MKEDSFSPHPSLSLYAEEDSKMKKGPDKVKDRPVAVISVAGAFRKGKSFLLDFFLRYLSSNADEKWLDDNEEPLGGFHWRGGKEIAVLLMDTQGAFDSLSTVRDCATIFALSAMLSSVLVYNLSSNIQEDDLQHLQLFTEYGRLALEDSGQTPFQKLQFLVRDWSYPYESNFGAAGGAKMLKRRLEVSDKQHPELQALRKHINSCFSKIDGFLLPHPGLKVATDPNFKGAVKDIEPCLSSISNKTVRCKELVQFFKAYMDIFKGDEMPEPKSMLEATSEANNLASLYAAKETYMQLMESVCGGEKPYISDSVLDMEHCRIKDQAMEVFGSRRKMGGEEFSLRYKEQLEKEKSVRATFSSKAITKVRTYFELQIHRLHWGAFACMAYVLSQILSLLGLYFFANLLSSAMVGIFLLLLAWSYTRYSGDFSEMGSYIDNISKIAWENVIQPTFALMAEKSTHYATQQALQRLNSTSVPPNQAGLSRKKEPIITTYNQSSLSSNQTVAYRSIHRLMFW
ncbi:ATL [Lepeophtheirus salmonis]|uniref:ATL n=1 Tax=Lepeophtheirus salmonis TaxID=72036 RepID=A0A7R8CHR1_LEPSM|nr:ATL [Lepeophtheirus salmonis]CAF2793302.1 ATL [Lepeophtheirus salmonis]